tara:strand:- start:22156 stop:23310 length:1155 start_codon:yes stop_codon:yes gene_type:complete
MSHSKTVATWPGSSSFSASLTPFGYYDSETSFVSDVDKVTVWCARRMGYPIVDIELQDKQFYACFEEAITEYSTQVNQFNIRENLLSAKGSTTGSNLTHREYTPSYDRYIRLAQSYGQEVGAGGRVDWISSSFTTTADVQDYDLNSVLSVASASNNDRIEIKQVYHQAKPAITRYFDPYIGTGAGSAQLLDSFGWGDYSPAVNFLMMPMFHDVLRTQAIELNDMIRKSAYSFEIINNKIKLFPRPDSAFKVHLRYITTNARQEASLGPTNVVTDFSNITYNNMSYGNINDPGKQWIKKYTLALAKELLGAIRSKYSSVPIPGAEINLDGDTLRSEGASEKDRLITELRENLEATSRKMMIASDAEEAEAMQNKMGKLPLPIYIG